MDGWMDGCTDGRMHGSTGPRRYSTRWLRGRLPIAAPLPASHSILEYYSPCRRKDFRPPAPLALRQYTAMRAVARPRDALICDGQTSTGAVWTATCRCSASRSTCHAALYIDIPTDGWLCKRQRTAGSRQRSSWQTTPLPLPNRNDSCRTTCAGCPAGRGRSSGRMRVRCARAPTPPCTMRCTIHDALRRGTTARRRLKDSGDENSGGCTARPP